MLWHCSKMQMHPMLANDGRSTAAPHESAASFPLCSNIKVCCSLWCISLLVFFLLLCHSRIMSGCESSSTVCYYTITNSFVVECVFLCHAIFGADGPRHARHYSSHYLMMRSKVVQWKINEAYHSNTGPITGSRFHASVKPVIPPGEGRKIVVNWYVCLFCSGDDHLMMKMKELVIINIILIPHQIVAFMRM